MRTDSHLFRLLIVLFLVSACENPDIGKDTQEQSLVFQCQAPEVKTVIASDGTSMYWSEYDNVAAYLYEDDQCKASDVCGFDFTSVSLNTASFYPKELNLVSEWQEYVNTVSSAIFYAFAPVAEEMPVPEGYSVSMNVPERQTGDFGRYQIAIAPAAQFAQVVPLRFVPATAIFSVRCHLTADSPCASTKIVRMTVRFSGGAVVGDCELDMQTGILTSSSSADQSEVSLNFDEPVVVSKVLEDDAPSHFNKYIRCSLIPSQSITQVNVTIYDKDGNSFESVVSADLLEGGIAGGKELKCDCVFYVDKVSLNDSIEGGSNDGFDSDWEIEL